MAGSGSGSRAASAWRYAIRSLISEWVGVNLLFEAGAVRPPYLAIPLADQCGMIGNSVAG